MISSRISCVKYVPWLKDEGTLFFAEIIKMLHRDDLPDTLAQELVNVLREKHPDKKIVFAGDVPTNDPMADKHAKWLSEYLKRLEELTADGRCSDCTKQIPGWNGKIEEIMKHLPKGWKVYKGVNDDSITLVCPECEEKCPKIGE